MPNLCAKCVRLLFFALNGLSCVVHIFSRYTRYFIRLSGYENILFLEIIIALLCIAVRINVYVFLLLYVNQRDSRDRVSTQLGRWLGLNVE